VDIVIANTRQAEKVRDSIDLRDHVLRQSDAERYTGALSIRRQGAPHYTDTQMRTRRRLVAPGAGQPRGSPVEAGLERRPSVSVRSTEHTVESRPTRRSMRQLAASPCSRT